MDVTGDALLCKILKFQEVVITRRGSGITEPYPAQTAQLLYQLDVLHGEASGSHLRQHCSLLLL